MDLQQCVDQVVHAGVQAYIELLCCGEQTRSRQVLSDAMQISALASGGPSARVPAALHVVGREQPEPDARVDASTDRESLARCLIFFSLRSMLASLLVLRATAYWSRVPALGELQEACTALNRCLSRSVASDGGYTCAEQNRDDDDHASGCACRRSNPTPPDDTPRMLHTQTVRR